MSDNKTKKISTLGSQATSVVSVSLVLLIVGLLASLSVVTRQMTHSILSNVSIVIKADLMATDEELENIGALLNTQPWAASTNFTSADRVLAIEMERNADILDMLGENPYSAEYEVRLHPDYVHPDSLAMISKALSNTTGVEEVISQSDIVTTLRSVSHKASLVLSCIALVLLGISLVLIYNTVSIAVYSKRFIIRTMQLVGATPSFIRKPFILAGVCWGIIAGSLAWILLAIGKTYLASSIPELSDMATWQSIVIIGISLIALGIAICGIAAYFATTRYLRASYDALYAS